MPEFSDARYEKSRQSIILEARGDFTERAKSSADIVIKKVKEIAQSIGVSKPKGKPFNTAELQVQMERDINQVLTNPAIPGIAKEKFLRDIELNANFFTSEVTLKKVEDYTKQRLEDSFGMTAGETIEENFSRMIYANFVAYVQGASAGLQHGFSEERYKTASGVEYRKGSMDAFSSEIRGLDKEYGIDIESKIRAQENDSKTFARGDLARESLYRQTMAGFIKDYMRTQRAPQDGQRIISLIQSGSLTTRAKFGEKTQVNTPKGKVDIVDIVLAYKNSILGFQGREFEARDAQSTALSDGISSKVKSVLGMDQLRSEFDHISVTATRDRIQHSSLADIVIMAKHLSQLIPVAGDALGVYMDSRDAKSGVSSVDGKFLSVNERAITAIFAVLGLVGVGAIGNRIRKGAKMIEIIDSLREAMKWLPAKLDAYIASGKALTNGAVDMFKQVAKMMGGSLGKELQDIMDKYMNKTGLQMNLMPSGVKQAQNAAESVKGIKEYPRGSSLDVRLGSQVDIKIIPRADGTYLVQVPGYNTSLYEGGSVTSVPNTQGIVITPGEVLEVGRGRNPQPGLMKLGIPDIDGTDSVSRNHITITIDKDGKIFIKDFSSQGTIAESTRAEKLIQNKPVEMKKSNDSIDTSLRYNQPNEAFGDSIKNGFIDGGNSQKFFNSLDEARTYEQELKKGGQNANLVSLGDEKYGVSTREFIIVDRTTDSYLNEMLGEVQKWSKIRSPEKRLKKLLQYVYDKGEGELGSTVTMKMRRDAGFEDSDYLQGKMNIGDIFKISGISSCRHRSLLMKVLGDSIGLETRIRKGPFIRHDGSIGQHAWNEVNLNGEWKVVDTTYTYTKDSNPTKIYTYNELPYLGQINPDGTVQSIGNRAGLEKKGLNIETKSLDSHTIILGTSIGLTLTGIGFGGYAAINSIDFETLSSDIDDILKNPSIDERDKEVLRKQLTQITKSAKVYLEYRNLAERGLRHEDILTYLERYGVDIKNLDPKVFGIIERYNQKRMFTEAIYKKHNADGRAIVQELTGYSPRGDITVKLDGVTLGIFVHDEKDQEAIFGKERITESGTVMSTMGFMNTAILDGNVAFVRYPDLGGTYIHEKQHVEDNIVGNLDTSLLRLKTEIVARIKQGVSIDDSKTSLLTKDGGYNYYNGKILEDLTWKKHVEVGKVAIQIAYDVKERFNNPLASILLSITPLEEWNTLLIDN